MIKLYFDWNVLAQIKNGNHTELNDLIQENEKLLIPFSTSHINDISSGFNESSIQRNYIESDLEFISKTTDEFCLFNTGKGIILDKYSPKEMFEQNISDKNTFNDISIDGLLSSFENDEFATRLLKPIFDMLKSLPMGKEFESAMEDPETAKMMDDMFPGLKDNPTMEGFFKSFNQLNKNLNESDGYKILRQTLQEGIGINRDKIFNSDNPYSDIDKTYDSFGFSQEKLEVKNDYSPKWFNDITNEYLKLDMHGYQEDKVKIDKGRKETFENTTDDSFHAAFASCCNFYITNDNRSYKKTQEVYKKLEINTIVFKPDEFVNYYNSYLKLNNPIVDLRIIRSIIDSDNFQLSESDNGIFKTYYFPYFIFGFFNKIISFYPNDKNEDVTTLLSQNKPSHWFIINLEVERLVIRLLKYFGSDLDNIGPIRANEFNIENWVGRKWKFENLTLRLQCINGHVQMYWDFESEKPAGNNV